MSYNKLVVYGVRYSPILDMAASSSAEIGLRYGGLAPHLVVLYGVDYQQEEEALLQYGRII